MPSGLKPVAWLHGYHVGADHPALIQYPNVPAVFVIDHKLMRSRGMALSGISNLCEGLAALPITIREGEAVTEIRAFADEHNANQVITTDDAQPRIQDIIGELKDGLMVRVLR